ncbi:MAG: glycine cleavage system aminomethyltransferase GcvT [Synechococcales bacterium]|nr:glycine cleavage system aminomethyltransferase GcvT [Synechococcales bacterium]
MPSPTSLARTPLSALHLQQGARMVPFSGWEMPLQYAGIRPEHEAVRQRVGMFDISHMGKFQLSGKDVLTQLQALVPSDLSRLEPGKAQYTVLLNENGGIIDDLIVYDQGRDRPASASATEQVTLIVNAATTEGDRQWLVDHLDTRTIQFTDLSRSHGLIALQGPEAAQAFQPFVDIDLSQIGRFGHAEVRILDQHTGFVARTGYTGEDGFEIMVPAAGCEALWRSLQAAGVTPCGLGARDTLRLEAALALYGQDIDATTTPLEAGLGWLVHLDRVGDFVGRSVLERQKQQGVPRKLVGLQMQGRNIARHDYPVLLGGDRVGIVTSGTMSPTLGYPVALAYVAADYSKPGQELEVEIRGKTYPATVVKKPFYQRR